MSEVAGAGIGRMGRNFLRERSGVINGLRRGHECHPIERVQVIEVDDVILHHLGEEHHVADDFRVLGDCDAETFSTQRTEARA